MRACAAALAFATLVATAWSGGAAASGLVDDFRASLANDPTWLAAVATRDAGVEARVQARAGLLPQVSFSGQRGKASTDTTQLAGASANSRSFNQYDTFNYSLQVRQPVFRMRSWAAYEQGKAQEAYAEANLQAARQELALRVVAAYAEWAAARAEAESAEVRVSTSEFLLRAAERTLQGGDTTRVEVEQARSRLAQARARRTDMQGQLQAAMLNWRLLTGNEGQRATQPVVGTGTATRLRLEPERLEEWQALAIAANSQIRALQHSVAVAREEARKVRADHYPTLDLYASRTRSQSDSDVTINQRFDSTRYGIQLSVPIYSGGAVDSTVRQALANLRRSEGELEAAKLKVRLQIERDWHAFQAARANTEAAQGAIEAARLAGYAARLGTIAGSATRIDEANALAQEADARADLAQAGVRALYTWARILSAADRLDEAALTNADALLGATPIASGSTVR